MIPQPAFSRVTVFWLAASLAAGAAALFALWAHSGGEVFNSLSLAFHASKEPVIDQVYKRVGQSADRGSGGPILVVSSSARPFSSYYAEILQNEGMNEFEVEEVSRLDTAMLGKYDVVLLGEVPVTLGQAALLNSWVRDGGNLIAMRPTKSLTALLGVKTIGTTLADGYLAIDTQSAAGKGLVKDTIQFHGTADLYAADGSTAIAELFRDATTSAESPAVQVRQDGAGQVAIFAYDLARSVVYTRQGNPAWAGMERDGLPPMRSDDLFYGPAIGDMKPDWVDMNRVAIPQADEQQRLLANLILQMNIRKKPLPRFWYFPRGLKAVVVMTGDDHGHGGTVGRFVQFLADSPRGCVLDEWQCVRGTSNIFMGSIDPEEAERAYHQGFEIGLHIYTGCEDWPTEALRQADGRIATRMSLHNANSLYAHQLEAFSQLYPGVPAPLTSRIDCITWGDFDTQPQVEASHGIRLDTNYYYWPAKWVKDRPGMFTGSGMPMRFAKLDGSAIDVYQAATQMTDESGQTYPFTIDRLLDNALGPAEFYGAFTANMHTDQVESKSADAVVASAKARGVPVVSAVQMLTWLDGRNGSAFHELSWTGSELRFGISVGPGANGLEALLPMASGNRVVKEIVLQGSPVKFTARSFAGIEYAAFSASPGKYVAHYSAQ